MNVANRVTVVRLFVSLAALTVMGLLQTGRWGIEPGLEGWDGPGFRAAAWTALLLFVVAAASDALDGYLARSRNIVTPFGRIADPFVDKVMVAGSLVLLSTMPLTGALLQPWMVVVIISREFLVNGIRGWMESEGINFQAAKPGKYKMIVQVLSISGLLLLLALESSPEWLYTANTVLIWVMLILTVYSGLFYVNKAARSAGDTAL